MMVELAKTRVVTLLTTVLWMGCLGYLGTTPRLPDIGGLGLGHWASLGHYGTHLALAALVYLLSNAKTPTLQYRLRALGVAVVATTLIGGGIEVVQAFIPERTNEVSDLVFDILGAVTGATAVFLLDQYNVGRSFLSMTISALVLTAVAVVSVSAVVAPPRFPAVRDCGQPESSAFPQVLTQNSRLSIASSNDSGRVTSGLVVLYDFREGSGDVVYDQSGVVPALPLNLLGPTKIRWLESSNGIEFTEMGGVVRSRSRAKKVYASLLKTGQLTVEAWVIPKTGNQKGPARIISMSGGTNRGQVNFHLGQQWAAGSFRLRTICEGFNWTNIAHVFTDTVNPKHVVITYDGAWKRAIIDGVVQDIMEVLEGDFSNWNQNYSLLIGNEVTRDRPFLGKIFLVAIYDRALSHAEIKQNFEAGPYMIHIPPD